jgi:polyphosphate kinase
LSFPGRERRVGPVSLKIDAVGARFTRRCHHGAMDELTDAGSRAEAGGLLDTLTDGSRADADEGEPLPADRFLDRELSWLAFNERVLELAEDETVPLLERAKFLAIFASNLDEFFMVRVAGLKRRIAPGIAVRAASGGLPREVHEAILARSREMTARHARCFGDDVRPALAKEGIEILRWDELSPAERSETGRFFDDRIFPVLTPLAVDPAHPFPYISGLSLNLAVVVRNPATGTEHFARVKVPPNLSRFHAVAEQRFVPLEDVIAAHMDALFPGMEVLQHHTFRVTRNEDVEVEEDDAENLLQAMERELMRRRFGPPVRLEVVETVDPHVLDLLVRELGITDNEVFALPSPLDLTGLMDLLSLDRAELKDPPFLPRTSLELAEFESATAPDILAVLRDHDVLLHHPYDSFSTSVQAFLEQAAADPNVLAIKQTLYRTSMDSPIVEALIDAAEAGKQVLVLVEIKARFDEGANIKRARKLEEAGCHVVYGLVGLKTHCKLSLVVRQEKDGIRRYTHIGTGNYHPKTARLYEDLGLLSADPDLGADLIHLFNHLTGYSREVKYRKLIVAPRWLRPKVQDLILNEAKAGPKGRIIIKMNSLVDPAMIDALCTASQAGVEIDLVIRGICCLRPGVPGLSDNIRVRSIVGRYLEHSRIYYFANGAAAGKPMYFIGSADLMERNLDRRVEALAPVEAPALQARLQEVLDVSLTDDVLAWELDSEGGWRRLPTALHNDAHRRLHELALTRARV